MGNTLILDTQKLSFREQVRFVRMYLQLSQKELADAMGISYPTVSRWEREDRTPQLATLGKFYSFCLRSGIEIVYTNAAREKTKL